MGSRKTLGGGKSRERKGSGEREREGEKRRGKRENRCHWKAHAFLKIAAAPQLKPTVFTISSISAFANMIFQEN